MRVGGSGSPAIRRRAFVMGHGTRRFSACTYCCDWKPTLQNPAARLGFESGGGSSFLGFEWRAPRTVCGDCPDLLPRIPTASYTPRTEPQGGVHKDVAVEAEVVPARLARVAPRRREGRRRRAGDLEHRRERSLEGKCARVARGRVRVVGRSEWGSVSELDGARQSGRRTRSLDQSC